MKAVRRIYNRYLITLAVIVLIIVLGVVFYLIGRTITGRIVSDPNPIIKTLYYGTSGMAPYVLHAHALDSELGAGDVLTATYEWDFGDPNGKYNKLKGWNAAHLYENSGTYTLTLKITNEAGKSKVVTKTIDIQPNTRKKIYVSNSGNDNNNGASEGSPVRTLSKAFFLVKDSNEVLLKREETFDVSSTLRIPYKNVVIGAYGTGSKPIVRWSGGDNQYIFSMSGLYTRNLIFENIIFDSVSSSNIPNGFQPAGINIAIKDSEFRRLSYGINAENDPNGLLLQDNTATLIKSDNGGGLWCYFSWLEGNDLVVLGNKVVYGVPINPYHGAGCHVLRTSGTSGGFSRLLVANNDFTNYGRNAIRIEKGSYAYLNNNKILGALRSDNGDSTGAVMFGPLGDGDGKQDPDWANARTKYVVFEGNDVTTGYARVKHGAENIMIKNNVIRAPDSNPVGGTSGNIITIVGYDSGYGRTVSNVIVRNNVGITKDWKGEFFRLENKASEITLLNNLYIAPDLGSAGSWSTAAAYVYSLIGMNSFTKVDNNTWPDINPSSNIEKINYAGSYVDLLTWNSYAQVGTDRVKDIKEWDGGWPIIEEGIPSFACSNNVDDDNDGLIDMADPGCLDVNDNSEYNAPSQCSDTIDNDLDGKIDLSDPGCTNTQDNDEYNSPPPVECADTIDNDLDGLIDYPNDPGCLDSVNDDDEYNAPPQQPPAAPQGLAAAALSPMAIDLSWNDVDGESGYKIERSSLAIGLWEEIGTTAQGITFYTDNSLSPSTFYYYRARAYNSAGDSSYSNIASARTKDTPIIYLCSNNLDDDGDGKIDLSDPGCTNENDNDENDPIISGDGLKATYYNNKDFTGTSIERIDPNINFRWGSGSPHPSIGAETFSARWVGYIEAPSSGEYTIYGFTDDGMRIWVDNKLLIDKWIQQYPTEYSSKIILEAGKKYPIKVEYFENYVGASAVVSWSGPGIVKQVIPQSQLYTQPPLKPLSIYKVVLVNADTEQDIRELKPNDIIDFSVLKTKNLNIRVETSDDVESVLFGYDGNPNYMIENEKPYSIGGDDTDNGINYLSWTPTVGRYTITITPYSQDRATGNAGSSLVMVLDVKEFSSNGDGLKAVYYNNKDFSGTSLTRIDKTINFEWGAGSPHSSIAGWTFSARWTGNIIVPNTGVYKFYTLSDDGARLWIDNKPIIDKWIVQSPTEHSGEIYLEAGKKYPIKVEYFENYGGASMILSTSGPGIEKSVVPQSYLYSSL